MVGQTNDAWLSRPGRVVGLLVAMVLFTGLACNGCDGTKEKITFTVQCLDVQVYTGASSGSMTTLPSSSSQSLPEGHRVSTDSAGQALLQGQLPTNQTCRIYVFQLTSLTTKACPKSNYQGGNTATCQEENTAAYKECKGNVQMTPSGQVEVVGSWLSLTYLPDRQLTLVIVSEGVAEVRPVTEFDSGTLGAPIRVEAQQFLYTAPDAVLQPIAGLPPRQPLPVDQLPPLVGALGIEPWIGPVIDRAAQDGAPLKLEPVEPPPPPPPTGLFVVHGAYGPLKDGRVQEAIAVAVDWTTILKEIFPDKEPIATLDLPDLKTTTDRIPYDPERARKLLAEAGYPQGFTILELVSEKDGELVKVGEWMLKYLSEAGLDVKYRVEPAEQIPRVIKEFESSGAPLLWLVWQ